MIPDWQKKLSDEAIRLTDGIVSDLSGATPPKVVETGYLMGWKLGNDRGLGEFYEEDVNPKNTPFVKSTHLAQKTETMYKIVGFAYGLLKAGLSYEGIPNDEIFIEGKKIPLDGSERYFRVCMDGRESYNSVSKENERNHTNVLVNATTKEINVPHQQIIVYSDISTIFDVVSKHEDWRAQVPEYTSVLTLPEKKKPEKPLVPIDDNFPEKLGWSNLIASLGGFENISMAILYNDLPVGHPHKRVLHKKIEYNNGMVEFD